MAPTPCGYLFRLTQVVARVFVDTPYLCVGRGRLQGIGASGGVLSCSGPGGAAEARKQCGPVTRVVQYQEVVMRDCGNKG
jgi:hypothetical protein